MSKKFDYPRDFKGIWLPKEIWLDDDLNATDKIIFAEIDSLDVEDSEGCFASNEYLSNFCKCSVTKVSTSISKLIELGYVKVVKTDGRKRWLKTSLSKFESQPIKNGNPEIQEMKDSNIPSNKDDENSDKNSVKYTLEDVKRPSSKVDMYASVPEKHKAVPPKKQNRYIPPDYTEEQLIEHIRPTIEGNLKNVQEDCGMEYNPKRADDIVEIVTDFFEQYREKTGHRHKILPDATLINIMYQYFNPPECLWDRNDPSTYSAMIEKYLDANFNARGGYDGEINLSISHFMSDAIRENCYHRSK